jgi:5-formyltetrahydrofolate cyclo-ligase
LRRMTAEERTAASAQARERLAAQTLWQHARSVLLFAPMPGELDIWPLLTVALAAGKRIALPRFERHTKAYAACEIRDPATDVQVGYYGIREPGQQCSALPPGGMDLILVPGIAFDEQGHRLGRGKAFYDRLLTVMSGPRCGVAFEQQIVPEIPVEPHDAVMDWLCLPARWIELAGRLG